MNINTVQSNLAFKATQNKKAKENNVVKNSALIGAGIGVAGAATGLYLNRNVAKTMINFSASCVGKTAAIRNYVMGAITGASINTLVCGGIGALVGVAIKAIKGRKDK